MRSMRARELVRGSISAAANRSRGLPRVEMMFSAGRQMDLQVPDWQALPVQECNTDLQDADGNFYFLFGYSAVGGPDIVG